MYPHAPFDPEHPFRLDPDKITSLQDVQAIFRGLDIRLDDVSAARFADVGAGYLFTDGRITSP